MFLLHILLLAKGQTNIMIGNDIIVLIWHLLETQMPAPLISQLFLCLYIKDDKAV